MGTRAGPAPDRRCAGGKRTGGDRQGPHRRHLRAAEPGDRGTGQRGPAGHAGAALAGGIPLRADGEVIGAIGTSGETPDQDESVSLAGAGACLHAASVPALTQEGARIAAEAAAAAATARGVWPVVAVVDAG